MPGVKKLKNPEKMDPVLRMLKRSVHGKCYNGYNKCLECSHVLLLPNFMLKFVQTVSNVSVLVQIFLWFEIFQISLFFISLYLVSAFNKHRRPTKSVGYFDQRRRLLFP